MVQQSNASDRGLQDDEIGELRALHGRNELPRATKPSMLRVLVRQFQSILIAILVLGAIAALIIGARIDAIAITLVIALNAVLGFIQEWRAEAAMDALRDLLSPVARVRRAGAEVVIPARDLVPGDIVLLQQGDLVPADILLSAAVGLKAEESALTGEAVPVLKSVPANDVADMSAFMGTAIVAGRAEGVVQKTGLKTAFGEIANLSAHVQRQPTTLQLQLGRLARQLGSAALLVAAIIVAIGLWEGQAPDEIFMIGLSLAVAVVPEGLPAVVTITIALGASAMADRGALARRMQAVETLGAASVICTDKTGTLTENKMTAAAIWIHPRSYTVTGTGYEPKGQVEWDGQRCCASDDPVLFELLESSTICNHARLERSGDQWQMIGEPTEGALIVLAHKAGAPKPDDGTIISEEPFTSERKCMSVVTKAANGDITLHMKGAPEAVLSRCTKIQMGRTARQLDQKTLADIESRYRGMASNGLRVIAIARKNGTATDEDNLTFLGLVGIYDPPRPEVKSAIQNALSAGIRVVMITGDSPVTAKAIATLLDVPADLVLTGQDLQTMDQQALDEALTRNVLFARTTPAHKLRIVEGLQRMGLVVAMTGDGVNDAPALTRADIGIAMGIRGTEVAKESADLVLLDDNFRTIVSAIKEGRRQFENVKKFVRYLLSSNAGEVVAITVNILVGGPLIFLATQVLWMNLVTDGVTAVALGMEKSETGQMAKPPRQKTTPILGKEGLALILGFGLYTGSASLWIFWSLLPMGEDLARTTAFTAMVVFEKVSVFAFRSLSLPNGRIGWFSNWFLCLALTVTLLMQLAAVYWPSLQTLLHTTAIGIDQWAIIGAMALPLIIVPELFKWLRLARE